MKFGFELEFAADSVKTRVDIKYALPKGRYDLGTDDTASISGTKYRYGLELRTHTEFEGINFPYAEVKPALDAIKAQGDKVKIGKVCGIHFHFSGLGPIDREVFLDTIDTDHKRLYWETRATWCDYYRDRETPPILHKYQPLRLVEGDHYECRLFNSTFNLRAFGKYFDKMVRAAHEASR